MGKSSIKEALGEANEERKIMICDEQIDIHQTTMKCFPIDFFSKAQIEKATDINFTVINTDNQEENIPPSKQVNANIHTSPESQQTNNAPIKSYSAAMKTNVIQATVNNNKKYKQLTKTPAVARSKNCPMKPSKDIED